jgi:hypothetical protein
MLDLHHLPTYGSALVLEQAALFQSFQAHFSRHLSMEFSLKNIRSFWAYLFALMTLSVLALAACGGSGTSTPAIKHVWVITLENKSFDTTWGAASQAKYLNQTLKPQGAFLSNYFGIGHVSQGNYIAMMSGQPLDLSTQGDCQKYTDFTQTGTVDNGIAVGDGCIYPAAVKTLPDQLTAKGLSWRGYMEDMGNTAGREESKCGRPLVNGQVVIGGTDGTQSATAADQYAARHNPFVYFHSLVDSGDCAKYVAPLTQLTADLAGTSVPNFSFITPNLCNDAHDGDGTGAAGKGCKDGTAGGLTSADAFLALWVPKIMASAAYKDGGLIIINFDEGDVPVTVSTDATGKTIYTVTGTGDACCNQPLGPNVTRPYSQTIPVSATMNYVLNFVGTGGDRVGALLLSPYITAGTSSSVPYNHYSLLKSLEDMFSVGAYLGYAGQSGLAAFGKDVFVGYY